jgi:hypothetical protein
MQDLNGFKNKLFLFSFGLGLSSVVALFQPNAFIKTLGQSLLGVSIGSVVVGELATGKAFSTANKEKNNQDEKYNQLVRDNANTAKNLDKTLVELNAVKAQSQKLESELENTIDVVKLRSYELTQANISIHDLQNRLRDVGKFSTTEAYKLVRETYNRSVHKLECHINALMRNYSPIADELNNVLIEVDKFRSRWITKLETYETITDFNDLLDTGLDFQQKIIEGCIELRVKGQHIAIRYLDELLENSVSYSMYETDIVGLQHHAASTIKDLKNQNEAQVRAIVSDWVAANNKHIENYEINYTQLIEDGKQAITALREREKLIEQLQAELEQLRKPWQFTGTIDYARAGNSIINFYYSAYGYWLDAMGWQETEVGYILTFATNRNKTYLTADMLHDKDNREQLAGLTNSLENHLPLFKPNYQSGLMILEITTRKASKKAPIEKLEDDVNKIWIPATKFESYVRNFERVRITAGSTGGKSPTAKNLALAIMNSRKGKGEIKLFDPRDGSKKDFWNMPKAGTSHEDNVTGMKELCELIDKRRNGTNHSFVLYLFDEVDNTIANLGKKANDFRNSLKIAIKEGSHCSVGAIFIGQSADANEIPGMTHSNWNNCVAIHIGSNAGIAIDTNKSITNEDKTRLLEQYRKIQQYCDEKNAELGLDIFTDATAYRFALVVPLTGLPKFIQLPDFDSYDYSEVMNTDEITIKTRVVEKTQTDNVQLACANCGSENIGTKGTQYHRCNECGKTWKKK